MRSCRRTRRSSSNNGCVCGASALGPVAQLVEQRVYTASVVGSNPAGSTTSSVYEPLDRVAVCRLFGGDRMSNEQAGIPAELAEALSENETAEKILEALPSSHQNEYLRWIGEVKRAETRQRRAAKAVEMLVDKHG